MTEHEVAVSFGRPEYCSSPPFHPSEVYPESPFSGVVGADDNPAYRGVRDLLRRLGMDAERFGTPAWNPLGTLVRPGDTVLLKPNFVVSRHGGGGDLFSAITHPSVLRAVADYVLVALQGRGRVLIADAPQMDCQWDELMRATGLPEVQAFYAGHAPLPLEVMDLRDFCVDDPDAMAVSSNRRPLPGDPLGSVIVDLGERSHFHRVPGHDRFYGADFDRSETIRHHQGRVHEYSLSRTVLGADVVISIPKLKVHKKVGVTLNVKGLVGINTNKNFLVHYRVGTPSEGGDQLPDIRRPRDRWLVRLQRRLFDLLLARGSRAADALYRALQAAYRAVLKPLLHPSRDTLAFDGGNWHGNDTAWRMAVDLLKLFRFAGADGVLRDTPQRRALCIVDGIVGGDVDGPLAPDARPAGCLIGGINPLAVDLVATRLMGFDPLRIRQFAILREPGGWDFGVRTLDEIRVLADDPEVRGLFRSSRPFLAFRPHPGWVGQLEAAPPAPPAGPAASARALSPSPAPARG